MARDNDEGAGRLAVAIATPQILVLGIVATAAAMLGHGWSLLALLGIAFVLSIVIAFAAWRLLLRLRRPPYLIAGALVGLLVGVAAAGLSFAAASADKHIGPRFGGSLLGTVIGSSISTGFQVGADAYRTNVPAVDVMTTPHRAVIGMAGGFFATMLVAAVIFGAIALPILTGLIGGVAAAFGARKNFVSIERE